MSHSKGHPQCFLGTSYSPGLYLLLEMSLPPHLSYWQIFIHFYCYMCLSFECIYACMYLYVLSLESSFFFIYSMYMYMYVCIQIFVPFFCFLARPKELKEFRHLPQATGNASPRKLNFVLSEKSLLSNFSNHCLPQAAAPIAIRTDPYQWFLTLTLIG